MHGIFDSISLLSAGRTFPEFIVILEGKLCHDGSLPTVGTNYLRFSGPGSFQRKVGFFNIV
jgi:hypothetical protein